MFLGIILSCYYKPDRSGRYFKMKTMVTLVVMNASGTRRVLALRIRFDALTRYTEDNR